MSTGTPNSSLNKFGAVARLARLVLALVVASPLNLTAAPAAAPVEMPVQWLRAGHPQDLTAHKIDRESYVTIEQLSRLGEAQLRWMSASNQACITNRNGELCFDWESKAVSRDDRRLRKSVAMRFEGERLYVPMSFVVSPEFEAFSATSLAWDPSRRQLVQTPEVNLRIPQVERSAGVYRLAFDVNPEAPPQLIEKSDHQIWLRFTRAVTDGSQILEGDTVINEVRVNQRRRSAELVLRLGDDAESSDVYFEDDRRRLVIEVVPSARAAAIASSATEDSEAADASSKVALKPAAAPMKPAPKAARGKALSIPSKPVAVVAAAPKPAVSAPAAPITRVLKKAPVPAKVAGVRTFVIDAGHGGVDSGAIGVRGTLEKDINLAVAKNLARQLRKMKNVRVIMTRDSDVFIPLSQRTAIANEAGAHIFVSVHCNSALSSKGSGFETYFLSADATDKAAAAVARVENSVVSLEMQKGAPSSKLGALLASMAVFDHINESSKFAALMSKKVREKSNIDKASVKEADFYVLRGAQMPALLLELEYLSNPVSEIRLRSSRYQNQLVKGIIEGILAYDRQMRQEKEAYASQLGRDSGRTPR